MLPAAQLRQAGDQASRDIENEELRQKWIVGDFEACRGIENEELRQKCIVGDFDQHWERDRETCLA